MRLCYNEAGAGSFAADAPVSYCAMSDRYIFRRGPAMRVAGQASREDKFASITKHMGEWVDQVLGTGFHKYRPSEAWSPTINLHEDETHYCIVVDLAGVEAEEIDLRPEGNILVLSGYRQSPGVTEATGSVRLHHMEIDHGQFSRSMEIPQDVDVDRIEAFYKQGLLWIRLPKKS